MTGQAIHKEERDGPAAVPPVGYAVVLPPGWRRIPLRQGTQAAIREIAERALARLPRRISPDQASPYRVRMEQRLAEAARKARQAGGIDLYLPVEPVHGTALPASFVVAAGMPSAPGPADCGQVIGQLLAGGNDAEPVIVDGVAGVRIASIAGPDPAQGIRVGSRRVDYVMPVPDGDGQWLVTTFSTPADGNPNGEFAELLTQLFDSVMLTFRWTADNVSDEQ